MPKLNFKQTAATTLLLAVILLCESIGVPGLGLTKAQEITAAILLIAAVLWVSEWVSQFVVSFLILALEIVWLLPALTAEGGAPKLDVFYGSFFSNIILLFLGGFVLSALMQKYGLDIRFAQIILKRTKGKAAATLLGIILACAFLSMWMSNTATTAMMLTIVFPLIKRIPEDHRFRVALVLSIPFACNIGGIGTPIGTPPNAIALSYLAQAGIHLNFLQWMMLTVPFMLVLLLFLWQLLMRLYPANGYVIEIEERLSGKLSAKHWLTLSIFLLTVLGWFFGAALGLKTGTVALLPIIAAFWFGLLDTNDFRNLPWDILYIISGGIALGVALQASGLGQVLVNSLPVDTAPLLLIAITTLVAGLLATVMSHTAAAGLLIPLAMSLEVGGQGILALILALALMCSMAMALPISTPPNAIAFSSRALRTKDMLLAGGLTSVVGYLVLLAAGPPYWKWFQGLIN